MSNAVDLSNLVQRIQDERAAIALNIFLDRPVSDDLRDLQLMVSNNVSLRKFTLVKVRNSKSLQAMISSHSEINFSMHCYANWPLLRLYIDTLMVVMRDTHAVTDKAHKTGIQLT